MGLSDVLAGFAEAGHAHRTNLLQLQYEQAKDLGEKYFQISQDPNSPPEIREEANKRVIGLHTLEPGKKMPKEWSDFTFTVTPPKYAPTEIPAAPNPIQGLPDLAPAQTVAPPPSAPYQMSMGAKIPFDTQTAQMATRAKAMSDAQYHPPVDNSLTDDEFYLKAAGGDYAKAREMRTADYVAQHPTPPKQDLSLQETELAMMASGPPGDPKTIQAKAAMDLLARNRAAGASQSDMDKYAALYVKEANGTATRDELTTLRAYEARAALSGSGMMLPTINPDGSVTYTVRPQAAGKQAPRGEASETAQANLGGWKQEVDSIDSIMPKIKALAVNFGPIIGRAKLLEVEKLGGMGATPAEIKLATELRRLLTSEAFANGGKQLTITEKEEFQKLLPHLSDTFESAVAQAEVAREWLLRRGKTRMEAMPTSQFLQMQPGIRNFFVNNAGSPTPPPAGSGAAAQGGLPPGVRAGERYAENPTTKEILVLRGGQWVKP